METERRHAAQPVELRMDGDNRSLSGYAAVFYRAGDPGTEYELAENYVERIAPGAFVDAIEGGDDVRGLFNHDANHVLGRVSSGTMTITEDDMGLRYDIELPDTATGNEVRTLVDRGDITGSSFGFRVTGQEHEERSDGVLVRTITNVSLIDVGPVTFPAYESTQVAVRAEDFRTGWRKDNDEPEAPKYPRDVVIATARLKEIEAS